MQRRSQSERSATTREKVIQSVIECIAEEGIQKATASRIAKRSGMTWGAIVHQFGDKDSVFVAVVEHNLEQFALAMLESPPSNDQTLAERVSQLIDMSWDHINQPYSLAFTELVLYGRSHPDGIITTKQEDMTTKLTKKVWCSFFDDLGIDPKTLATARNIASATMLGMSIQGMISAVPTPRFKKEISALKTAITDMLSK
jgi:AcrR family transcriptional regulator